MQQYCCLNNCKNITMEAHQDNCNACSADFFHGYINSPTQSTLLAKHLPSLYTITCLTCSFPLQWVIVMDYNKSFQINSIGANIYKKVVHPLHCRHTRLSEHLLDMLPQCIHIYIHTSHCKEYLSDILKLENTF